MQILVVDDDEATRDLWSEVVGRVAGEVVAEADAAAARRRLMTQRFDLVLLDLHLGSDSGLSVATLATYANPRCRVIVITGSGLFARGELFAMDPSIVTVLRKPVDPRELIAMCEHHSGLCGAP